MINNFVFCNLLISCASFSSICWPGNETSKSLQITLLCAWTDLPGDFVLILACSDVGSTSRTTKTTGKANKCSLVKSSFTLPIGYKTHGSSSAFGYFFCHEWPLFSFCHFFPCWAIQCLVTGEPRYYGSYRRTGLPDKTDDFQPQKNAQNQHGSTESHPF